MTLHNRTICYLVRHGATENNEQNPPVLQGQRFDAPLSAAGREQADRTGRFLASHEIQAFYCSPLGRAKETAERIAAPHGLAVEVVEELIEADVGEWEGVSWDKIQQNDPEAYEAFMTDAGANGYLGGESMSQVLDRAGPALDDLLSKNVGRRIVIVAHNVINRVYLARLMKMPLARYRLIVQDNCGLNVIRFRRGEAKLTTLNSVFHLED